MSRFLVAACAVLAAACSPTFNWREVRPEGTRLAAMLPCKPDVGEREVPIAGKPVRLKALGCETGGQTFVLLHADLGDPAGLSEALAQWRRATQANLHTPTDTAEAFVPPGALALPQSLRVGAQGRRADGTAVHSQAAYFAQGSRVFQAAVYADKPDAQAAQVFFAGLKFE
jgi:hypothetical protein